MLNQRQIAIILEMYENRAESFTADYFARKQEAGLRTVQADMKAIKEELESLSLGTVASKRGKGSSLQIDNYDNFAEWVNGIYLQYAVGGSLSYPMQRIERIVFILLGRFRGMPWYELEESLHVSRSTLQGDLKGVQSSVSRFGLEVNRDSNRLAILGSEISNRRCLAENSLYLAHLQGQEDQGSHIDMQRLSYLKNILIDVFMECHYIISDTDFNNAVLTLNISLHRQQHGFYIKQEDFSVTDNVEREMEISRKVYGKVQSRFFCKVPEEEVHFFAVYLKGQEIFQDHAIISRELDEFIGAAFVKIRHNYGVDFTNNISLRIAVALHCIPLLIRIKYDMQLEDKHLTEVKRSFPLGYEIAQYFTYLLSAKYGEGKKISQDETALLAAHFYGSILELRQSSHRTRVLVISTLKASMTLLFRSMLIKWFSKDISELDFINAGDMREEMLDNYDVFLTTEKNEFYENGLAMHINHFPTENDKRNLKLLLDGFADLEDVVQIFSPELFFCPERGEKEEILKMLVEKAGAKYGLTGLHEAVLAREAIGSTFFTRGIAVPHPIQAVSSDTFVAVCIVKEPVLWDEEGHRVQVIMMMHIGKNNPKSFQLWDCFSRMFEDKSFAAAAVREPDFQSFVQKISLLLTDRFT